MEFLDVVDAEDRVIGKASKNEVYEKGLAHRIVHVMVLNGRGEMLLQMRSKSCSFCPMHWSTSVGGHVRAGEPPEEAALREYDEELGTRSGLEFLAKDFYRSKISPDKFLITYRTTNEGPFRPDRHAVERVGFFGLDKVQDMIDGGKKFHPELLFILKRHFGVKADCPAWIE